MLVGISDNYGSGGWGFQSLRARRTFRLTLRALIGSLPTIVLCACLSAPAVHAVPGEDPQKKFVEYQLAANVAARHQTCFRALLGELRAVREGVEGAGTEQEFAARWGLERFDPNTGFDDAAAVCIGKPVLQDLGIESEETILHFVERKRAEWEKAESEASGAPR